jgi:type I restriction enzyme R subunit
LSFLLQYGLAYIKQKNGLQKHIMRYPQMFATKAIEKKLEEGIKKGIIWHTQGSGKSLTMVWLAKWVRENVKDARVLIITDRTELDQQIEYISNLISKRFKK